MILINSNCILYQKLFINENLNDTTIHDWMREVDINDHIANNEELKEWGRQMIREIHDESCILFLQGVVEEAQKIITEHNEMVAAMEGSNGNQGTNQ